MKLTGGHTVEVYRYTRDRHGDAETEVHVRTIEHCALQPVRVHPVDTFGEIAEVIGIVWAPRDSDFRLEDRDRIVVDGNTYRVVGGRMHDENHPVTGHDMGHYGVRVEAIL